MMGKKLVTLILTGGVLLALLVPAMAQDTEPAPDPAADSASEASPIVPTPAPLTATTDLFVTSQFRVNVRSGPGTNYTIIGTITFTDSLDITGQNAEADWLRVNFNGQEGWVFANVVEVNGALEAAPVVEAGAAAVLIGTPETEVSTEDTGDVVVMTRYNTNLRSSFSTDADVLDIIPFDTELLPEGRTDDNDWVKVTVDDQSGWIFAPILFFASGEVETLPVLGTTADEVVPAQP